MLHDLLEGQIILFELLAFLLQLLLDVLITDEDALQIHPFLLNLQPYFNALRNQVQSTFPISNPSIEGAGIFAGCYCLQVGQLIFQQ